ncbi:MAG: T9SS type A sorting domain-containing protein, partial [Bacteroidota bacterium]
AIHYVSINDPGIPFIDYYNVSGVSCYGANDGSALFTASGIPPISYNWSNSSTDSMITGLSPGYYSITITDGMNCDFSCAVEVTEPDPIQIYFTHTDPVCYGGYTGSANVYASGGTIWGTGGDYTYLWSNGEYHSYNINRPAGILYVTVTDDLGCTATGSVTLTNPPQIQVNMYPNDVSTHGGSDGYIDIIINNGTPPYSFNWSNGASVEDIGGLSAGNYTVTVTDSNGCTRSATATVSEPDLLSVTIQVNGPTTFCYGSSVTLNAGNNYVSYLWSSNANSATTQSITVTQSGMYSVTVTSPNSYGVDSVYIEVISPYASQEICVVTIDSVYGKNIIVWEKPLTDAISSFNIYKETTSSGIYNLLATVPYLDMSEYIDMTSDPSSVSARYKISVVDTCGNESGLSTPHKTMHLTVSTGVGVYNLIWENYEGFTFGSYTIYRGTDQNNLLPIGAIQSTLTTYTDYQPIGLYYYQIAVEKTVPCIPTSGSKAVGGGPYSQSVSNLEDNGIISGEGQVYISEDLLIYPNPFHDYTSIEFRNDNNCSYTLSIYDISGKTVHSENSITGNKVRINRENLSPGFYTVELKGDKILKGRIIIE